MPYDDCVAFMHVCASKENVSFVLLASIGIKKKIPHAEFVFNEISETKEKKRHFFVELTNPVDFLQQFPVACFNAKCQMR